MPSHSSSSAGDWGESTPRPADPDAIAAELRDHLECRREELESAGMPPDAAAGEALRRFGNVERVARELHEIQNKERIMASRIVWAVLLLMLLAMSGMFWMQRRNAIAMTDAVSQLSQQIARSAPYEETVVLKVVDEAGAPYEGISVTLSCKRPASNLVPPEIPGTSDAAGRIEYANLCEGEYYFLAKRRDFGQCDQWEIMSPNFIVWHGRTVGSLSMTVPRPVRRTVSFETPDVPGWKTPAKFRIRSSLPGTSRSNLQCDNLEFGVAQTIWILPGREATGYYTYKPEPKTDERTPRPSEFEASAILWAADSLPEDGAVIRLGQPRNQFSILDEAGVVKPLQRPGGNPESAPATP